MGYGPIPVILCIQRPLIGHPKQVNAIAFSPDSHWLATGGGGGSVHLYDLTQSDPTSDYDRLLDAENTNQNALSLDFSPDNHWLAAGVNLGNDEKPIYTVHFLTLKAPIRPATRSAFWVIYAVSGRLILTRIANGWQPAAMKAQFSSGI